MNRRVAHLLLLLALVAPMAQAQTRTVQDGSSNSVLSGGGNGHDYQDGSDLCCRAGR